MAFLHPGVVGVFVPYVGVMGCLQHFILAEWGGGMKVTYDAQLARVAAVCCTQTIKAYCTVHSLFCYSTWVILFSDDGILLGLADAP